MLFAEMEPLWVGRGAGVMGSGRNQKLGLGSCYILHKLGRHMWHLSLLLPTKCLMTFLCKLIIAQLLEPSSKLGPH